MQGVYTNIDELNIPIERPAQFEGRKAEESTAEEMAEFTRQSNETRRRTYEQVGGLHHRYDRRAA
jgi:hypothetical protein